MDCIEVAIAVVLAQGAGRRDHSLWARRGVRMRRSLCGWMAWAGYADAMVCGEGSRKSKIQGSCSAAEYCISTSETYEIYPSGRI